MLCTHIVYNVNKMSESEKRTPISVYLTPRAAMILRDYNEGSGYGSVSRTVEEIILAFDSVYKAFKNARMPDTGNKPLTESDKALFFVVLTAFLQNIENSISRLKPSSESNQEVNQ
jgi:hypothetical protein